MTQINWDDHIDEAKRLYEGGISLNKIAKHYGVYHGGLAKALTRAGVSLRPRYQTGPLHKGELLPSKRTPMSRRALSRGATADQAGRIHYREVNIAGLTKEMGKATDEARRKWLYLLIEEQRDGIEKIMSEGAAVNIDSAGM